MNIMHALVQSVLGSRRTCHELTREREAQRLMFLSLCLEGEEDLVSRCKTPMVQYSNPRFWRSRVQGVGLRVPKVKHSLKP